jgi:hypothetical protein
MDASPAARAVESVKTLHMPSKRPDLQEIKQWGLRRGNKSC